MIYIDILTYEFAADLNSANLPLDWPYQIKYVYDLEDELLPDWVRLTEAQYNDYIRDSDRVTRYNLALDLYTNSRLLKISDIVDDNFSSLPPDKLDFRRHLRLGVYLNKEVSMLKNGRPDYCTYKYNGEVYAKVRFEFSVNQFNLVYNKKTWLGYYNKNNQITEEYLLTDESTDLATIYGLQKGVQERYQARSYIFDEIKSYVNAVILQVYMAQGKTYEEVLSDGGNFWKDYSAEISSWCHIGGMSVIVDKLNLETNYPFLLLPSGYGALTIKEWIIDRITY